ncbi:MAG: HAD family phosphatase [Clostridia bacterium]|nr:HAD family phosphatase [Clostridia bacterium]
MIKGIIFDMDGTLLESMEHWRTCSSDFVRENGKEPAENLEDTLFEMSLIEGSQYLVDSYFPDMTTDQILDGISDVMLEKYRKVVEPKPHMNECLREMSEMGLPMTIATSSGRDHVEAGFGRHGVLDMFHSIHTCGEVGAGKTKPDVFLAAARAMGLEPSEVAVFEDSAYAIKTAKAAGFVTVAVPDNGSDWHEVSALADIALERGLMDWKKVLVW